MKRKSKFGLRLISVLGSSLLVTLQLAPLAKAQSGNMSDATGQNGNFVGNMSDATGLLTQLLDESITEINGIILTAELRQLILTLSGGNAVNIDIVVGQVFSGLIASGVPQGLAMDCVANLRGLFVGGQLNTIELTRAAEIYQQILSTSGVNVSLLLGSSLFQSVASLLGVFGANASFPVAAAFPIGGEINGITITAELQQLILTLQSGDRQGIGQLVSVLTQNGVPGNLAAQFSQSLGALFVNGQINFAQLTLAGQIYQQIISTSGVNISLLSSLSQFQSITGFLTAFGVDMSFPVAAAFPIGGEINGITITAELQQLLLTLQSGDRQGIGQLVSVLTQNGVPGNRAAQFGQSLGALFVNGRINFAQLTLVSELYQQIISVRGQYVGSQLASGMFPSIASMLAVFGFDVTIPIAILPAGNISDATGLTIALETEEVTSEEVTSEDVTEEEVTEEEVTEEEPIAVEESLPESEVPAETSEGEEGQQSEVSDSDSEQLPAGPTVGLAATSQIQAPSDTSTAQESQAETESETTSSETQAEDNAQGSDNAGAMTAGNAIVTSSDIAGGFQFATSSIFAAVIQAFQSVMAAFGTSQVAFGSISISVEVQVTVVSVMTGSSVSEASVPTYVSSLNGGGALASAPVDTYVNNLVNGGVPTNYARALAATMEGMVTVDENGDVTNVDATKLTTAIAVYNETVNQLSAEALRQPSETLACTGYVLSSLTEAAANAANQ